MPENERATDARTCLIVQKRRDYNGMPEETVMRHAKAYAAPIYLSGIGDLRFAYP